MGVMLITCVGKLGEIVLFLSAIALVHGGTVELNENGCPTDHTVERLLPHESYCEFYYHCVNGQMVPRPCPLGLHFNPEINECDWSEIVQCYRPINPIEILTRGHKLDNHVNEKHDQIISDEIVENSAHENNEEGDEHIFIYEDPRKVAEICVKDNSDGILVSHENCNQYYKCYNGIPLSLKCPKNLLYNPQRLFCDWSYNVECGERVIPEIDDNDDSNNEHSSEDKTEKNVVHGYDDPTQAPFICTAEGSDGIFVAHEFCDRFYQCSGGTPVTIKCPQFLLYNPKSESCDWSVNVQCDDRIIPDDSGENDNNDQDIKNPDTDEHNNGGGHSDPSEAPAICAAKESDSVLVAHEHCNKFYQCSGRKPVSIKCPGMLLYNSQKEHCDWPKNVDCGDRVISNNDENEDKNDEKDSHPDLGEQNHGNSQSEATAICGAPGSHGVLIAHENCNKFYKCYLSHPVTLNCPGKLLYNPILKYCDWPHRVNCGNRLIGNDNQSEESDVIDVGLICASDGTNNLLLPHENCSQFYQCFAGKAHAMHCPIGLHFNSELRACDWPANAHCNLK